MPDPFWYLLECPDSVDGSTDYGNITIPSTTTSDEDVPTPSTSTPTLTWLDDDSHAANMNQLASSVGIHHPAGTLPPPEPTVLLIEIQKAAEDVAQVVGRFGPKMAATLTSPSIKAALFPDDNQLRLPSLRYADSFTCRLTERFKKPASLCGEAPLLWWLWDALLKFLTPSGRSPGFTLEFAPARNTDIPINYTISIKLKSTAECVPEIEMTAAYGGPYGEQRIFSAPIAPFRFPEPEGFDETTAALAIDEVPYEGKCCYSDMLDYLLPRRGSIWRSAMEISKKDEKRLVTVLAGTCKAGG